MSPNQAIHKFFFSLLAAILLGILLNVLLVGHLKDAMSSDSTEISLYLPAGTDFDTNLYYSFSDEFKPQDKINGKRGDNNEIKFSFPKSNKVLNQF